MRSRLDALKRLMSLYGDVEEMHSMELQRTTASVREAEHAIDVQRRIVHSSGLDARKALISGDLVDRTVAKTQREIAEWKQQRLQQARIEREMLNDEAAKQYLASHLQSEQMKHLVEGTVAQAEIEAGRRTQAALDDRFLARRRWTDTRDGLRENAK